MIRPLTAFFAISSLLSTPVIAQDSTRLSCQVTALTEFRYFEEQINTTDLSSVKLISDHGHSAVFLGSAAFHSEANDQIILEKVNGSTLVIVVPLQHPADVIAIHLTPDGLGEINAFTLEPPFRKVADLRCN